VFTAVARGVRATAKTNIRFVMSVCLSFCSSFFLLIRIEDLGSQWTDFNEILYLMIFRKSAEKLHFDSNPIQIMSTLHED